MYSTCVLRDVILHCIGGGRREEGGGGGEREEVKQTENPLTLTQAGGVTHTHTRHLLAFIYAHRPFPYPLTTQPPHPARARQGYCTLP